MAYREREGEGEAVENLHGYLKLYGDGTVVRNAEEPPVTIIPTAEEPPNLASYHQVLHKDIFDGEKGLQARIYLPPQSTPNQRFPLILYFHGGGFCFYSPTTPACHRLCLKWASHLGAIIVSVNYRLAPEHRLPAAYEDSIAALRWLQHQTDTWLVSHADLSKLFVAGHSAGGNIAHHVGRWAADPANGMVLRIKGMVLLYPFFGAEERRDSEMQRGGGEKVFTSEMSDAMWRLALPRGSNRDHPYCNPLIGSVEHTVLPPMLFVIAGRDILRDIQLEYCEVLNKCGKHEIEKHVFEDEDHGFTIFKMDHPKPAKVLQLISDFISHNCCS